MTLNFFAPFSHVLRLNVLCSVLMRIESRVASGNDIDGAQLRDLLIVPTGGDSWMIKLMRSMLAHRKSTNETDETLF